MVVGSNSGIQARSNKLDNRRSGKHPGSVNHDVVSILISATCRLLLPVQWNGHTTVGSQRMSINATSHCFSTRLFFI